MRYNTRPPRRAKTGGGPPAWFVFLVGVALVFGLYYLVQGVQNFFRTGGQGVVEATERAVVVASATAGRVAQLDTAGDSSERTPFPSRTPIPECQNFVVSVPNAIVRDAPSSGGTLLGSMVEGEEVCVLGREPETEWYVIDRTPGTRRLDIAYMHETVIRAVNPTPTPSRTPTALATVTPLPTLTPTRTPSPQPTVPTTTLNPVQTAMPQDTATPTEAPTLTPSPTTFRQTA